MKLEIRILTSRLNQWLIYYQISKNKQFRGNLLAFLYKAVGQKFYR